MRSRWRVSEIWSAWNDTDIEGQEGRSAGRTENVNPGINPLFFSQKMLAKLPEKKIPSTAANATRRSAKTASGSLIHLSAQSALRLIAGIVSIALKRLLRSEASRM